MKRFLIPTGAILAGLAAGVLGSNLLPHEENTSQKRKTTPVASPVPTRRTSELRALIGERLGRVEGERPEWYRSERKRLRQSTASPYRCASVLDQAIEDLSADQLADMLKHEPFDSSEEIIRAFSRLAETDPVWALEVLSQTPFRTIPPMNDAITAVFTVWAKSNPNQALDWCYNRPPNGMRQQSSLELTDAWLKVDPAAVAKNYDRLENARGPGVFSAGFPDKLMRAWVAKDPAAAGEWVESLAAGKKKTELQQAYLKAGGGKQ
ncbi:MAG TPA: hypothetical protein VIM57_10045 [Luteolibacter sp.]